MFSVSAFNCKRKMSLRHSTDQVCLSHCQAFFPGLASVEQLSELKQTHTVRSGYQDPSDTLMLNSQFSQQHCFHTAGSLLAISHTPLPCLHMVTSSLTLSKY